MPIHPCIHPLVNQAKPLVVCEANPSYPLGFSFLLSINAQLTLNGRI
nr:MAG TPA: hypothetical protein [Microviridae sp.]